MSSAAALCHRRLDPAEVKHTGREVCFVALGFRGFGSGLGAEHSLQGVDHQGVDDAEPAGGDLLHQCRRLVLRPVSAPPRHPRLRHRLLRRLPQLSDQERADLGEDLLVPQDPELDCSGTAARATANNGGNSGAVGALAASRNMRGVHIHLLLQAPGLPPREARNSSRLISRSFSRLNFLHPACR
eukprot:jgi/Tetstr1/457392/TSEL_043994.t1